MNPKVKCFSPRPRRRRRQRRRSQRRCYWDCSRGGEMQIQIVAKGCGLWMMSWLPDSYPAATINNLQQLKMEKCILPHQKPRAVCLDFHCGRRRIRTRPSQRLKACNPVGDTLPWRQFRNGTNGTTTNPTYDKAIENAHKFEKGAAQPASVCLPFWPKKKKGGRGRRQEIGCQTMTTTKSQSKKKNKIK